MHTLIHKKTISLFLFWNICIYSVRGEIDRISTDTFIYSICCAANVYIFVYICIGTPIVPLRSYFFQVLQKYLPGGFAGYDKEGSPLLIEPYGDMDFKGLLYSARKEDIEKTKLLHGEHIMQMLDSQSKKVTFIYLDNLKPAIQFCIFTVWIIHTTHST